jgi:REP element-mobilizing transposase RayT
MSKYFYQSRKLPHWQPPGETFFITARLYGSIPRFVIENIKAEYQLDLAEISRSQVVIEHADTMLPDDLQQAIERIKQKKSYDASKRYFASFDDFLDSNPNEPHWLKHKDVAKVNADNFHHYGDRYFQLWAFTIMSNHVHLLLTHNPNAPILWKVLQDMKKFSGLQSNRILNRSGHFWEHESYDHWVREGEFERILHYILNNPVKAGIVRHWKDYPWTYCHPDLIL